MKNRQPVVERQRSRQVFLIYVFFKKNHLHFLCESKVSLACGSSESMSSRKSDRWHSPGSKQASSSELKLKFNVSKNGGKTRKFSYMPRYLDPLRKGRGTAGADTSRTFSLPMSCQPKFSRRTDLLGHGYNSLSLSKIIVKNT